MSIKIKRAYEPAQSEDGLRVLVDRLWPRGVSRDAAKIDLWLKEVAPSSALRKWFAHDPARWDEFRRRYSQELESSAALQELREHIAKAPVTTLVFSAKDTEHNNAVALREFLTRRDPSLRRR